MILRKDIVHFCVYLINTSTLNTQRTLEKNKKVFKCFIQSFHPNRRGFLSNQASATITLNTELD